MVFTDSEQCSGKNIRIYYFAVVKNFLPVYLCSISIGIDYNVTNLTDTKTAVNKMLESMAYKVKQMVCMV